MPTSPAALISACEDRLARRRIGDAERPVAAAQPVVAAALVALHALEERQHVGCSSSRRLPICAQVSKSCAWPRTKAMPLIALEPPSSFPRGTGTRRPLVLASGSAL